MKKILLIEDDAVMRENTAEILGLAQYEVLTAKNGKEGVALAMEYHPDLIVCDIMMPELDGYGVLHILAKNPTTMGVPFIFLTAKAEKSEMRKGMELGADDYLTKPFEETELLNAIEIRFKKNEILKREFAKNEDGLNQFLNEARGLKDLAMLSQDRKTVRFKKKEVIFREGDEPKNLFFLNKGRVKSYKFHENGNEYITSLYNSGDFFGYISLLEKSHYGDTAVALEDCELCLIPQEDFLALLYKNRDAAGKFIKMLAGSVLEQEKKLLSLAFDTVRKRVAEALLALEKRYRDASCKQTRILAARNDLAGMAGTATETVIRCLSDLKSEKLIDVAGREIIILNLVGLQDID